ncbi:uncharacterized protein EDB93DRAFT_362578 [Suillus bovinus]|uniref:uncharacterized protein n=1 Tax=Suillus bovinus TaxID=48563 RepID=UPI001B880BC8|nr:uncharacterized protein EDB93DRAFT_362578 [Suillus bovinus]KAG2149128.1 hypothetical protein EDB93DRAFT_362578 [Suillus bovinus]
MHFVRFFTCVASCLSVARAFSVTVGAPTQCGSLDISWTGGQAPFEILLTPSSQTSYQNITPPSSAFSNGKGSYSIPQLSLSAGTTFLLTMSDATGFGSGGTTNTLTVGNQVANNVCNTSILSPPYTFRLSPLPLIQCSQFTIQAESSAVLPITIVQLIPGGQPVVFNSNSANFTSVANVTAGTDLMYLIFDSLGRQGGISGLEQVVGTGDFSCLSANLSSTTVGMSATTTTSQSSSSSSSSSSLPFTGSRSSSNVALIAGTAGGGGAVLIALIVLGMRFWRKTSSFQSSTQSYPHQLERTDPKYKISFHSDVLPQLPFTYETDPHSYYTRPIQPSLRTQSDMTNSSAGYFAVSGFPSSFNQTRHSRQSSNTYSPVYGDSRSSTLLSTYNRQSLQSTGNFTVNDPHTPFNQISHSRQGSNADFVVYEDARNLAISSVDRRMATVDERPLSLSQETDPLCPSIQSGYQPSAINAFATNLAARDHHVSFNQTQPSHQSSNTAFAVSRDGRMSDMTPVEHMAVGARPARLLPRKPVPPYLASPVQSQSQSIFTSADDITVQNSPTPFDETQNSHHSPDTDSLAVQGESRNRFMASASAQTAYQHPTRMIVHTGAGDVVPGNQGSVEPPPQYSEDQGAYAL